MVNGKVCSSSFSNLSREAAAGRVGGIPSTLFEYHAAPRLQKHDTPMLIIKGEGGEDKEKKLRIVKLLIQACSWG